MKKQQRRHSLGKGNYLKVQPRIELGDTLEVIEGE